MATTGLGAKLEIKVPPASVFTEITDVSKLTCPSIEVSQLEYVTLGGGGWKRFLNGVGDAGELTAEIVYSKALYQLVMTAVRVRGVTVKITGPDEDDSGPLVAVSLTFAANLKMLGGPEFEADKDSSFQVTFKVDGAITVA